MFDSKHASSFLLRRDRKTAHLHVSSELATRPPKRLNNLTSLTSS